jgi:hypothetical protein
MISSQYASDFVVVRVNLRKKMQGLKAMPSLALKPPPRTIKNAACGNA